MDIYVSCSGGEDDRNEDPIFLVQTKRARPIRCTDLQRHSRCAKRLASPDRNLNPDVAPNNPTTHAPPKNNIKRCGTHLVHCRPGKVVGTKQSGEVRA